MQASYVALENVAVKVQGSVEKAALSASTTVNKALDAQVLKLREAGVSYTAIIAKQGEFQTSSAALAASIERTSKVEIAAMQATRAEADR